MKPRSFAWLFFLPLSVVIVAPAHAEEEEADFKGYTRPAELAVAKLLKTVAQLRTYSDDATVGTKMAMGLGRDERPISLVWEKPTRFRLRTQTHDVCSNGATLTVYAKQMRRYTRKPLEPNLEKQVRPFGLGTRIDFSMAAFLTAQSPRSYFAERFTNLDIAGDETIEGDRCVVFEGSVAKVQRFDGSRGEGDVTLWLRKPDHMIRRLEVDVSPKEDEEDEDEEQEGPFRMFMRGVKVVYDVRDLTINKRIDESEFDFESPTGAKKVDRFYSSWTDTGDTAAPFELSGKAAPDFELETTGGKWISRDSLKGNVVVLNFLFPRLGFMRPQGLKELDEVRRAYADRDVVVLCVYPQDDAEQILEDMERDDVELTVVLDPGSNVTSQYFTERFAQGLVLVDKKGIVQGRYQLSLTAESAESLRKDIDKLLKGETLPGGKPLTDEQLEEAREQRSASFTADAADPMNEDDLREAWTVRATNDRGFGFRFGARAPRSRGLWIRDKDVAREVGFDGEVISELPIPNPIRDQFSQDEFVVGRFAGQLSIAYMATIPGDGRRAFGWRAPKGATITVSDAAGRELWNMELEAEDGQAPQDLTAGDLDGKAGDELLFYHQGSLWLVDGHGRVIVRKLLSGRPQWIRVEDLDRDDRDEIYVRTQYKLHRFDYRPRR